MPVVEQPHRHVFFAEGVGLHLKGGTREAFRSDVNVSTSLACSGFPTANHGRLFKFFGGVHRDCPHRLANPAQAEPPKKKTRASTGTMYTVKSYT